MPLTMKSAVLIFYSIVLYINFLAWPVIKNLKVNVRETNKQSVSMKDKLKRKCLSFR